VDSAATRSVVTTYFERLLNQRDLSVCEELLASDYVDHDAPAGATPGPAGTKAFVTGFLDAYPDLRVTVADLIADGGKATARLVWQGTHRVTGEPLRQMGIVLLHLNQDGKIAERWSAYVTLDGA
jgi:predicted SnoaL-like aldol condensation-catalyzing enzyme